jgi:F420-dependent oxidoreductase-like protein
MKFGIDVEAQDGLTWEQWGRIARRAEELGYESLWRADHLQSIVSRDDRPGLEAWTSFAYLATETKSLRFGPLVSPMTFRHPSVLAAAASSIDVLSGGRLEVGLGAGWYEGEHDAFGLALPPMAERFGRLDEGIRVLKALWSGERCTFDGEWFALRGAVGQPRPTQRPHPPIVIGGTGERRTLRIVAEHADEWNLHGVTPEVYRGKCEVLERHCEEVGRDPATIKRSIAAPCAIGETHADVLEAVQRFAAFLPATGPAFFPQGEGTDNTIAALRARGWLAGTPDEVEEQVRAFEAHGIGRMIVQIIPSDDRTVEVFGSDVLPRFRRHDAALAG